MLTIKIKVEDTLSDYSLELTEVLTDTEANMINFSKLREDIYDVIKRAPTGN